MTPVETDYRFVGPDGELGLLDLFAGRRQLVVYRFFYQSDVDGWPNKACGGCSYFTDHIPHLAHVNARDTTFVMASPADQDKITRLKQRMGWDVPWYTLLGDAFSNDFGVAEMFGLNVFLRDGVSDLLRQRSRCGGLHPDLVNPRDHPTRPTGGVGGHP